MTGRWAVIALALAACGGTSAPAPTSSLVPAPSGEPGLGLETLARELEAAVLENYVQLTLQNTGAWADGLVDDREVILFGVTPGASVVGDRDQVGTGEPLYARRNPRLLSKNLEVWLSTDGSVGWVFDEMSYRVDYLGREASIPLRVTSVYLRDLGRWLLAAQHVSYAMELHESAALALRGEMRAPAGFDSGGDDEAAAALLPLIARLHGGGEDDGGGQALAVGEKALLVMPGPVELRGADILAARPLASQLGPGVEVTIEDHRVELGPSGRVAWIGVTLRARGADRELGLRGSYVFERGEEVGWRLVLGHLSTPLSERQVSLRVFGPPADR